MQHYNADEYLQAVDRLEESLREALSALEECRALCEGPLEDEEVEEEEDLQPGLYEAIAGSVRSPKGWVRKPFFLQWMSHLPALLSGCRSCWLSCLSFLQPIIFRC